ncbi:hypothetical protein N7461_001046 [Penicillium sp. DV-2018c]|nr:hypothetical protein N7461_001046 [Penicillium sp. DV-2018c]
MAPKRKPDEVIAELPPQEEVRTRTELLRPCSRRPRLQLPSGLNVDSAYALFSLFFTDDIFEHIRGGANESGSPGTASRGRCAWHKTTSADIKIFVGIIIYMGLNSLPRESSYWKGDSVQRRSFQPYMSLVQFQQIKRFLHISWPTTRDPTQPDDERWWYKLEPLASTVERAARQYYHPGANISIDETMVRCFGRSKHTVKIPNKPIKQGYKLLALAD